MDAPISKRKTCRILQCSDIRSYAVRKLERIPSQREVLLRIFSVSRTVRFAAFLRRLAEQLSHFPHTLQESLGLLAWMELESVRSTLSGDLKSSDRSSEYSLIRQALSHLSTAIEFGDPGPCDSCSNRSCHLASKSWESTDWNAWCPCIKNCLKTV